MCDSHILPWAKEKEAVAFAPSEIENDSRDFADALCNKNEKEEEV